MLLALINGNFSPGYPTPLVIVNLFSGAASLFQKGDWETLSVEKTPKCLLQSVVPFLALGVKDVPSLRKVSRKRGGGTGMKEGSGTATSSKSLEP